MPTQLLSRPGGTIAYDDQGSGPLVLCAPGLGDLRGEYRFLAPRLVAAGYRVVTMDLRGHGESSAGWHDYSKAAIGSDIVALIRHLNIGPARVIGNSYAGGAAVCAAAEAPELVAGIVLIDAFVRDTGPAWQRRVMGALYSVLFGGPWGVALWKWFYPHEYPTRKPDDLPAYLNVLLANLRERGRLSAVRAMMTGGSADSQSCLGTVRCPALVVMGTRDPDFKRPQDEAAWIAAQVHGAVHMIEGAGHYPHAELPDATAPAIVAFFDSLAQQTGPAGNESESAAAHGD